MAVADTGHAGATVGALCFAPDGTALVAASPTRIAAMGWEPWAVQATATLAAEGTVWAAAASTRSGRVHVLCADGAQARVVAIVPVPMPAPLVAPATPVAPQAVAAAIAAPADPDMGTSAWSAEHVFQRRDKIGTNSAPPTHTLARVAHTLLVWHFGSAPARGAGGDGAEVHRAHRHRERSSICAWVGSCVGVGVGGHTAASRAPCGLASDHGGGDAVRSNCGRAGSHGTGAAAGPSGRRARRAAVRRGSLARADRWQGWCTGLMCTGGAPGCGPWAIAQAPYAPCRHVTTRSARRRTW
jgi:hypothetical protein